jgi:hypothetical protein
LIDAMEERHSDDSQHQIREPSGHHGVQTTVLAQRERGRADDVISDEH